MNVTSYYWSYIDFFTFIIYASYITYTLQLSRSRRSRFQKQPPEVVRPSTLLKRDSYTGAFLTYFEEHLWTTASVYWLLHHIFIFTIHYSTRFPFLQIFHYYKLLIYYAIKTIELMTREAIFFLKKYFTDRSFQLLKAKNFMRLKNSLIGIYC